MYLLSENDSESLQIWLIELKEFQLDSMFDTNVMARAYLYTNSVSILESGRDFVKALVGENNKYEAEIILKDKLIQGRCSCLYDGKCKHLAALILVLISSK